MKNIEQTNNILREVIDLLDIPQGYYQKAVDRYQSMSDHFHRPQSSIRNLDPLVHPQGSFRLGTVIRPLVPSEGYDLDLVCRVNLNKGNLSQKDLKELIGSEVKSYSVEKGFKDPPEDKTRCWTQQYQDEVDFHMDVLPGIPAGGSYRQLLLESGVAQRLVDEAIDITDKTKDNYGYISSDWPSSNPRGYGIWFEQQMDVGGIASISRKRIVESSAGIYESADDVPAFELKTPLQRVVQLLKRHRDQMFQSEPDGKPISIILTTLASRAYRGEADLAEAMQGVLSRMADYVESSKPRIANPVDPTEDFTDRWNTLLEDNFWRWLRQAKEDFEAVCNVSSIKQLNEVTGNGFGITINDAKTKNWFVAAVATPAIVGTTQISSAAPRSWGSD